MEITIKNRDTGEAHKTNSQRSLYWLTDLRDGNKYFRAVDINRISNNHLVEIDERHYEKLYEYNTSNGYIIVETQQPVSATTGRWQDEPASSKQLNYLAALGVSTNGMKLTKGEASRTIELAKHGELSAINIFSDDNQPTSEIYGDFG